MYIGTTRRRMTALIPHSPSSSSLDNNVPNIYNIYNLCKFTLLMLRIKQLERDRFIIFNTYVICCFVYSHGLHWCNQFGYVVLFCFKLVLSICSFSVVKIRTYRKLLKISKIVRGTSNTTYVYFSKEHKINLPTIFFSIFIWW